MKFYFDGIDTQETQINQLYYYMNKDPIILLVTSKWNNGTSKDSNLFANNKILLNNYYCIFIISQNCYYYLNWPNLSKFPNKNCDSSTVGRTRRPREQKSRLFVLVLQ